MLMNDFFWIFSDTICLESESIKNIWSALKVHQKKINMTEDSKGKKIRVFIIIYDNRRRRRRRRNLWKWMKMPWNLKCFPCYRIEIKECFYRNCCEIDDLCKKSTTAARNWNARERCGKDAAKETRKIWSARSLFPRLTNWIFRVHKTR